MLLYNLIIYKSSNYMNNKGIISYLVIINIIFINNNTSIINK